MSAATANADDQTQFAQLRGLFHELIAMSAAERLAHLAALESSDTSLHRQIALLLANFDEADLSSVEMERLGQRIGPFELEAEIGRGGMGVVYRARRVDGAFEQRVALKLLPVGTRSRSLARRFRRERQILALLVHPAIVRLLDGGVDESGRPWLAMELVEGEDLIRACQTRRLDLPARVKLMIEVCSAVAHAHSCLIVHRDIKPSNILVDAEQHPRLLDFGIARLDDDSREQATVTVARVLTPRYAAPEQLAGERAGTAADVYSLGVVLREMVDLGDAEPWHSSRRAELSRIVAKASAPAREDRYSGAAAMADDLRDWLAQRALRSGIGSASARLAAFARGYRWPLISVAGVVLALAVGATLTWRQAVIAERQALTASAHVDALLEVLSAASPESFSAREPGASEFLVEAARRLQSHPHADDLMLWRSLSQIGAGLMNLNHFEQAQAVLESALSALDRIQPRDLKRELDTLRLLTHAQRGVADIAAVRAVGERIAAIAADASAPAGPAVNALASAASTLSRIGDPESTRRWLAQAELRRQQSVAFSHLDAENYWRQRGWASLRILDLKIAREALEKSLAVIDAHPGEFPALRRAEAELLLTETALLTGAAQVAHEHLTAGAPAMSQAFPADHPDRAYVLTLEARTQLLLAQPESARLPAIAAVNLLEKALMSGARGIVAEELVEARAVLAQSLALVGDCTAAERALREASPAPRLPSRHQSWMHAVAIAGSRCAARKPADAAAASP